MRRAFPTCKCNPPATWLIYDPVGGYPSRCGQCGGELVTTEEGTFTPPVLWPWVVALVVLEVTLLVALVVHLVGPGLNSSGAGGTGAGATPAVSTEDTPRPNPLPPVR